MTELQPPPFVRRPMPWGWLALVVLSLVAAIGGPLWMAGTRDDRVTARGTFTTDNLIVDSTATLNGRNITTACEVGLLAFQTVQNNFSPACLATNTELDVTASDNSGSIITGVDAVGKSLPVGSEVRLCNIAGPGDATIISFKNLDVRSSAANRILTPEAGYGGRCSVTTGTPCWLSDNSQCPGGETCAFEVADYYLGPNECATLKYKLAWQSFADTTHKAWVMLGQTSRFSTEIVQQLNFYPPLVADHATGTIDDYDPTNAVGTYTCTDGAGTSACGLAGSNMKFLDHTLVVLSTSSSATVTILGLHYLQQFRGPGVIGPYKIIYNAGPGTIVLRNHASATAIDDIETGAAGDARGDVVLAPNSPAVELFHLVDAGGWQVIGKRDYWFQDSTAYFAKGVQFQGVDASQPLGATWSVTESATKAGTLLVSPTANIALGAEVDNATYDTTAQAISVYGHYCNLHGHRGAGANALINTCGYFSVSDGDTRYALKTDVGDVILNAGGGLFDSQAATQYLRGTLSLGAGLQTISGGSPTVDNGTLSAGSTNWVGSVTGIGAHTSVTLTFSPAFGTRASCPSAVTNSVSVAAETVVVTAQSRTSATFSCYSIAAAPILTNCDDFTYQCVGQL